MRCIVVLRCDIDVDVNDVADKVEPDVFPDQPPPIRRCLPGEDLVSRTDVVERLATCSRDRRYRLALDSRALRTIHPSPAPIASTRTIIPRTLKRRNLRQGRATGAAGMAPTLGDGKPSLDASLPESNHTKNQPEVDRR